MYSLQQKRYVQTAEGSSSPERCRQPSYVILRQLYQATTVFSAMILQNEATWLFTQVRSSASIGTSGR